MKKIFIYFSIMIVMMLAGCLKDHPNVDFSGNGGFIAEISHASITGNNAPSAGLDYFSAATLPVFSSTDPDTITFDVNIASDYPPTKDVSVTLAIDDAKRVAYNGTGGVQFAAQPDSTFSFPVTTAVIKAGSRLAQFMIIYYPAKIDPTQSYLLPITLTSASGMEVSGNLSTIYFHIIGNAFAGGYVWDFTRYSAPSNAGSPDGNSFTGHSATFVPVSPTQIEVKSGYYIGPRYEMTFTDNGNGTFSDFKVILNADDVATMAGAGVIVADGPNILTADPVTKTFTFQYTTLTRYVIDSFHK
jgi:Domain of unknown function (DUF1735)